MIRFPMKFEVEATATQGTQKQWTAQANSLPPIQSAIPPEFMGPGKGYSPEDLFALALLNCLIATFKVYCERSKVSFHDLKGKIVLTVDRMAGETGIAMTHADIYFDINGASDVERARKLLETSSKDCAVSNSIKTGKTFHININ